MIDPDETSGVRAQGSSALWEDMADPVHDDDQAVLDALARRARRTTRHTRRAHDAPVRILKLMD